MGLGKTAQVGAGFERYINGLNLLSRLRSIFCSQNCMDTACTTLASLEHLVLKGVGILGPIDEDQPL